LRTLFIGLFIVSFFFSNVQAAFSTENEKDEKTLREERMSLYKKAEATTHIPWYYFAGIDQYERQVRRTHKDIPHEKGALGIYIEPSRWVGPMNPHKGAQDETVISLFGGIGKDGNGDGKADQYDDEDILYTIGSYLQSYGITPPQIKIGLWQYYHRDRTVSIILGHAKLFKTFGTLDLDHHAFPLPLNANFSYKNTWGDARGWGGRRIHEGTDIFANYSVPVRSTCYGIVEMKGWNRYGGWRLGIRDVNNNYHYFAHLNGFTKDLEVGQVVEPGMVVGGVGSTGYGPPGTSGKFPPHLHYGMYKDNGRTEWSFDPYSHLKMWERSDRQKAKGN
jgi:murein DD-endopeptidase MepM/ murein hydrolase activator NlpD